MHTDTMSNTAARVHAALAKPALKGATPSQAELVKEQAGLQGQHRDRLARVQGLVEGHASLSTEVKGELSSALEARETLASLSSEANTPGLLASLARALGRRRAILERKSAAEQLVTHFQSVQVSLSKASAFSDELRLCALELQAEVDRLHEVAGQAGDNARACAHKILEIEAALESLETTQELSKDETARFTDALRFEERTQGIALELFRARRVLCQQELEPARELRDTVLSLHEDMSRFVQQAGSSINGQGHRIQALGLAADAPLVIAELQERMQGMDDLASASQLYIDQAQHLLTDVLPELSRRLASADRSRALAVSEDLEDLSRERARELADRALRDAADAEVSAALGRSL